MRIIFIINIILLPIPITISYPYVRVYNIGRCVVDDTYT